MGPNGRGHRMADWSDGYWWSNDGLRLHYRDYAGRHEPPADPLHPRPDPQRARLRRRCRRGSPATGGVICVDLRGRGESAYAKDPMTYVPLTYLAGHGGADRASWSSTRFVLFGTSLGGLITMLLATTDARADRRRAAQRHRPGGRAARARPYPLLCRQAAELADLAPRRPRPRRGAGAIAIPTGSSTTGWSTPSGCASSTPSGRIVLRLRHAHRRAVRSCPAARAASTCGRALPALAGIPSLVVRGELSDLLSAETVARMKAEHAGDGERSTVPRVGHAPTLDEPEVGRGDRPAAGAGRGAAGVLSVACRETRRHDSAGAHPPLPFDLRARRQGGARGAADRTPSAMPPSMPC